MIDPRVFGCDTLDELVVAYIDGDLSPESSRRLESTFAALPELRGRVERARCLRALVSTLPRVAVPNSVRDYTARLATLSRSNTGSHATVQPAARVEFALGLLPHRSAPVGLADRVLSGIRAEKARVELAARRRSYRPTAGELVRASVAALLLFGVSMTLLSGRSTNHFSSRKLAFDLNVMRPGQTMQGDMRVSIDPILAPPSPRRGVVSAVPSGGR